MFSNLTMVVEIDADGNIVNSLQGDSGKMKFISEASRVGDNLFFGSPYNKYLGRMYLGSPAMEVDGKGVRMKRDEDTDENEAEVKTMEPGLQKDEEDGVQMEEKKVLVEETFESLKGEKVQSIAQGSNVEVVTNGGEVEQPVEKPVHEEAFVVENKQNTEETQKQVDVKKEELEQKVEYLLKEEWEDVQKGEETKEVPNLEVDEASKKNIMKEEL